MCLVAENFFGVGDGWDRMADDRVFLSSCNICCFSEVTEVTGVTNSAMCWLAGSCVLPKFVTGGIRRGNKNAVPGGCRTARGRERDGGWVYWAAVVESDGSEDGYGQAAVAGAWAGTGVVVGVVGARKPAMIQRTAPGRRAAR